MQFLYIYLQAGLDDPCRVPFNSESSESVCEIRGSMLVSGEPTNVCIYMTLGRGGLCVCMSLFAKVKSSASPEHTLIKGMYSVGTLVISASLEMVFFLEGC